MLRIKCSCADLLCMHAYARKDICTYMGRFKLFRIFIFHAWHSRVKRALHNVYLHIFCQFIQRNQHKRTYYMAWLTLHRRSMDFKYYVMPFYALAVKYPICIENIKIQFVAQTNKVNFSHYLGIKLFMLCARFNCVPLHMRLLLLLTI